VADQPTSPLDRLVELAVYAPVGLAVTVSEELPSLVDKGRRRVTSQVVVARMVGRFAVSRGAQEVERLASQAATWLDLLGGPSGPTAPTVAPVAGTVHHPPRRPTASPNGNGTRPVAADVPHEGQLAIPGYDSLSAPQVVKRLDGLVDGELDAVRQYEEAHRGRRTILSKIAQLQADNP
jgi:hypothetical protein